MSEKFIITVGLLGSIASILAFFGVGASDIPKSPVLLYTPVVLAACISLWIAGYSQWKLFSSARSDFELNPPQKRLRNVALVIFFLCITVFVVLFFKVGTSPSIGFKV